MSFVKSLLGAKVGAVVGTVVLGPLLGPVGTAVGAKVGALVGSGGNPLTLLGMDDIPTDIHGNPTDGTVWGRPTDIQGNVKTNVWGRPI